MKPNTILITLLVLVLFGAVGAWLFYWNKPQKNIEEAQAISVKASDLFQSYASKEVEANNNYTNKIVEVTGMVETLSKNAEGKTIALLKSDDLIYGVNCTMEIEAELKLGETVTLKGMCTGYLTDVIIIRCYKVK